MTAAGIIPSIKTALFYEPRPGEKVPGHLFFKHRYFRAFAFLMMCLLNTLVYYGWQPFSMMLYRSGAYRWQCSAEEIKNFVDGDDYCESQGNSVKALFNIGLCCEFVIGLVAGFLLDHCGPLITGAIGSLSFFLGWMLFAYSSSSFVMYIPAMIFLAGSVNLIAFPCLCLGDLFPSRSGFAISVVVAAETTGTAVAPIMKLVWDANPTWTYSRIVWGYLGVCFVPFTLLYLLALPLKRLTFTPVSAVETMTTETAHTDCKEDEESPATATTQVGISPSTIHRPSFLKQVFSVELVLFTAYYVLQVMQYGYYPNTVQDEFGRDVANVQGYILPTQGLFGALFGLVVDRSKTLPICFVLIFMMTGAYILALIPSVGLQYLTTVLYVISNSYVYTVKYTYIAEIFPPTHFGVLIGLVGCMAGALGLLNIPIQNAGAYSATCIAYIAVGVVAFVICVFLWFRQRKGIDHIQASPQQLKEAALEDAAKVDME